MTQREIEHIELADDKDRLTVGANTMRMNRPLTLSENSLGFVPLCGVRRPIHPFEIARMLFVVVRCVRMLL